MARPLAGRPVRSRTIEALAATTATPAIDDLLERSATPPLPTPCSPDAAHLGCAPEREEQLFPACPPPSSTVRASYGRVGETFGSTNVSARPR
jgi:hypothetical protein